MDLSIPRKRAREAGAAAGDRENVVHAVGDVPDAAVASGGQLSRSASYADCRVASHARLEAVLKQTELLRKLDAEAHDAVVSELEQQRHALEQQVQTLQAAAQRHEETARQLRGVDDALSTSKAMVSQLRSQLSSVTSERDAAAAERDTLTRHVTRLQQELQDAHSLREAQAQRFRDAAAASATRAVAIDAENAPLAAGSRMLLSPGASEHTDQVEQYERQLMELRDAVRAAERRERAATAEAKKVVSAARSSELLSEQVAAAEAKARRLESAAAEASSLRARLQAAASVVHSCIHVSALLGLSTAPSLPAASMVDALCDVRVDASPVLRTASEALERVKARVGALQSDAAAAAHARGDVQSRLSESVVVRNALEQRALAAERDAITARVAVTRAEAATAVAERRYVSLKLEYEDLRSLLATYAAEDVAFARGGGHAARGENAPAAALNTRIAELSKTVDAQRQALHDAHNQLAGSPSPATLEAANARIAALEATRDALAAEVAALYGCTTISREFAGVDATKEEAAAGIDTGGVAAAMRAGTDVPLLGKIDPERPPRVLHMVVNPTSAAFAEYAEKLKAAATAAASEVTTLKKAATTLQHALGAAQKEIAMLRAGSGPAPIARNASGDATPDAVSLNVSAAATAAAALDADKSLQRMKQVFKASFSAYREAVTVLTGYKVIMEPTASADAPTEVIVKSMFAERDEDYLKFIVRNTDPIVSMVETPYTTRLEPKLMQYLQVLKSTPAFLAALTLDLFEKQTMTTTMGM